MKKGIIVLAIILFLPVLTFAHSGRTDSSGGHKDNKNKSGLGSYHYHCGGYPAHLHSNGSCPYKGSSNTVVSASAQQSSSSTAPAKKETYTKTTSTIKMDDQIVEIGGIIEDNRTLVEMRPLCDLLGIQIEWDGYSSTAICTKGDTLFKLKVGSTSATVNGVGALLDVAPKLVDDKTVLPVRFIAEAIGKTINYNAETNTIEIY